MHDEAIREIFEILFKRYPALEACRADIWNAYELLANCYEGGGKVLICGNGGSAADAEHIVGELMKGFLLKRKPEAHFFDSLKKICPEDANYIYGNIQVGLPAISLVSQSAFFTSFSNDVQADMVFAQQVYGYGYPGDVVIGISTSGKSKNVLNALKVARARGIVSVLLTGARNLESRSLADAAISVPETETFKIQELHLPVYHALCAMTERAMFEE